MVVAASVGGAGGAESFAAGGGGCWLSAVGVGATVLRVAGHVAMSILDGRLLPVRLAAVRVPLTDS